MIDAIATRGRKKAKLPKRPPVDFAQLIVQRRADRANDWLQTTANNHYHADLQRLVELENQLNERHRLSAPYTPHLAAAMAAHVAMGVDRVHLDRDDSPPGERLPPQTDAAQLASLLVPDQGLLNDGRLARNLPVLTQAERTARLNLRNARAFPELIASGNAKLRLRMDPVAPA